MGVSRNNVVFVSRSMLLSFKPSSRARNAPLAELVVVYCSYSWLAGWLHGWHNSDLPLVHIERWSIVKQVQAFLPILLRCPILASSIFIPARQFHLMHYCCILLHICLFVCLVPTAMDHTYSCANHLALMIDQNKGHKSICVARICDIGLPSFS